MDKRVKLHIHGLCRLSKGYYSIPEILEMEEDMLFAVDWKFTPTPIEFVKQYVELFPELLPTEVDVGMSDDELIAAAQEKVDKVRKCRDSAMSSYLVTLSILTLACICCFLLP